MSLLRAPAPLIAAAFCTLACAPMAAAQDGQAGMTAEAAAALQPGQYLWSDAGGAGPVRILVSIPLQRALVYRGDTLIGVTAVSTGAPGYDTPTGIFTVLEKDLHHRSNLYNDAPMPFMLRLTWDGIAIHAGRDPGHPASHGCVRVPAAFAKKLFGITALGAQVIVSEAAIDPFPAEPAPVDPPALIIAASAPAPSAPMRSAVPGTVDQAAAWAASVVADASR